MANVRLHPHLEANQQDNQEHPFPPSLSGNHLPDNQSSHSKK
jgi:hypothetical protein